MNRTTVAAGVSLALLGVYMNVPFALLAARFDYPDVLRRPAGEVLTRFHEAGAPLVGVWYAYAAAALLFVPMAMLTGRAVGRVGRHPEMARAATVFGVLAGVAQAFGLLRWVFLVPYLAGVYADPTGSPAARDGAVVAFEAFHRFAGVAVGEHLGQLFTALWCGLLAASLPVPWLRRAGVAIAATLGVGLAEGFSTVLPFSPGALAAVTPLAYIALSAWMVALGIVLARAGARPPAPILHTKETTAMNSPARFLTTLLVLLAAILAAPSGAQAQEPQTEAPLRRLYLHAFRSPSIGLEYRQGALGVHAGLYTTILSGDDGDSTEFFKTGVTYYFGGTRRSEVFLSTSYLRGRNRDYEGRDAFMVEPGALWRLGRGFEFRLGAGVLAAQGRETRINPTVGVSWSLPLR